MQDSSVDVIMAPKPSPAKPSPATRGGSFGFLAPVRNLRFSKEVRITFERSFTHRERERGFFFFFFALKGTDQVAEQAEEELSSILKNDVLPPPFASKLSRASTPSPRNLESLMDSPSPSRSRYSSASSSPRCWSPLSRAQNPSTNASPTEDAWGEGTELGLLALSPERARRRRSGGSMGARDRSNSLTVGVYK